MRKIAIIGAAILATAFAGPTMAKEMKSHRHHMTQRTVQQQDANAGRTYGWNGQRRESGFWPGDVAAGAVGTAAGVAGAAIGTAGAIATAPFRGPANAYAYDNRYAAAAPPPMALERGDATYYDRGQNGWYGDWNTYAAHNGIVCRPGTMFKDGNVMRHCQ
ncbi:hypothetical protein [Bradyrhizobium sp. STM 3557]|uniref:hypothetical protein n=1 Tax=Bradyrhizobium sp. STM 3557 TaxID=578920 RepID=UPI00388E49B6